jgi:mersacidin/lichenicidin family type 2 lantibiotic
MCEEALSARQLTKGANMTEATQIQPEVIAKAWEDPHFRSILPPEVISILPPNPAETDRLSESFLERVSQSNSNTLKGCTMSGPNCATHSYTRPCSRECK